MITLTLLKKEGQKTVGIEPDSFIQSVRKTLSQYGRDYAIGAVRGLAVRNMMSVSFPDPSEGFYPLVKIHEMALKDLENIFYNYVQSEREDVSIEDLIIRLVDRRVWERGQAE